MTAAMLLLTPALLVLVAYLAGRTRRGIAELDEQRRLAAMDERRAAHNLYPERRVEVAPQRPPGA